MKSHRLGLVVFDLSYTAGIGILLNAGVTIYVLSLLYAADNGHPINMSRVTLLFGLKFIPIVLSAWALTWFGACQCALQFWNSDMVHNLDREKLQILIQWALSIFFIIVTIGPIPVILWAIAELSQAFYHLETIVHDVVSMLRFQGKSYDPQDYKKLSMLGSLLPVRKLGPLLDTVRIFTKREALFYGIVVSLLLAIHLPLLWISLRGLYKQSKRILPIGAPAAAKASGVGAMGAELRRERSWIVRHALYAVLSTAVHLPPLAWQLAPHAPGFIYTAKFRNVNFHTLTFPFSVTGNIVLLLLNIHVNRAMSRERKLRQQNAPVAEPSDEIEMGVNDERKTSWEKP